MSLCRWCRVVMVCNHGCSVAVEIGPRHLSSLHSHLDPFISTGFPCQWQGWQHSNITSWHLIYVSPQILKFHDQSMFLVWFTWEAQSCIAWNEAVTLSSWLPFEGIYPEDLKKKKKKKSTTLSLKRGYVKKHDVICGPANLKSQNTLMWTTPFSAYLLLSDIWHWGLGSG